MKGATESRVMSRPLMAPMMRTAWRIRVSSKTLG